MHRGAFTRSNKLKLAAVLREKPLAGALGNSLAPRKSRLFPTKFLIHELFSKNIRNIFLKQVPIQKLSSPHCDEMEGREIRRSRRGASALKIRPGAPWPWHSRTAFLSVGERGRRPRQKLIKNPCVLRCFVLLAFFLIFRSLWLKMGQHGPT